MNLSELINEILSEWAYRLDDGQPNPKNEKHLAQLSIVLSEMGLSNIKDELFENIAEADGKQFTNPILNKSIKYKNSKGEDAEGIVGNLLRLPKDHPGRIAAEKLLPADAAEKDAAMQDLGSEKDGKSGELAGQKPSGKEDEAPQAGGEEEKMKQAAAMFDPEVDPAMASRLDREKAASAKLAKTDKEDAVADKKVEDETNPLDANFNPIEAQDVAKEMPQADPDVFGGGSDIPDGIDSGDLAKFNTDIQKVKKIVDDAKANGEKAPNINLCQITVPGTNLYCDNNLGIPREEMPQFKGKAIAGSRAADMKVNKDGEVDTEPVFKEMLNQKGIKVTQTEISADKLKATQNELVGAKVVGMLETLEKDPKNPDITAPIYVSRDGYVVDGHHRWAAIAAYNAANPDSQIQMKVNVIDSDIKDVIPMANKFAEDMGIAAKKADANKPETAQPMAAELKPYNDNPESNIKTFKGEASGIDVKTIQFDGGGQLYGTPHRNEKAIDDIVNQVKATIPKERWKDIVFVGEGGRTGDGGELQFNDEQIHASEEFKKLGAKIDTWDGDELDVHTPESNLYKSQEEQTGLSQTKIKAGNWASMIGQGEGTDTMKPSKFLDEEGKQFLQDAAKEAGFPPIENWNTPTEQDKDTLYRLSFPDDNGDTETEVNDVQVAFNRARDLNIIKKQNEISSNGKIPVVVAGDGHADLVDDIINGKKEKPSEKLPEPEPADEKPGGVIYPIGGNYYSDTPDGPAQYVKTESIVNGFLLEGDEKWLHLLFEKTVNKTTPSGKNVTVNVIEPKDQTKATSKASSKTSNVNYDDRLEGDISAKVEQTYNTDSKFSEPGMKHEDRVKRLKAMKAKEINSVKIDDIYKVMGVTKGKVKFPSKYMSVLANALNFAKGPFTITDLTDAAGAGTLDSTLGELVTLMGATIQDENQRNAFFNYLREQIKAGGNTSALTAAWVNSAQDSCVAFHRKIAKDCPGGHEVKTNFWDIPSEAQAAGVKNYKRDKGKSTDINTMVDCISKDGSRTQKWLQPSLKKSKKVNAFNSTTGRVFATTVLRWGTPEEKAQYAGFGNELDSYNGLEDNAPAGDYKITDKRGNERPMTIKERKTQLNKSMREIEDRYEDKIPAEANPKQAVIRQAKLHKELMDNPKVVAERDEFLTNYLNMKPAERKKVCAQIAKDLNQKGDKYTMELMKTLDTLAEYDLSTPENYSAAIAEMGITSSKDVQKLNVALMNGVINTLGTNTTVAGYKKKLTKNSHDHSKAVLEYLIRDNDNKKALLENISTQFPLKDLMEGKEWAILGEKGGGINLDKDTITKCLGAEKFEDVVEKLIIVDYKGEPTLAYATDNGERTIPIGEINCRPDGIMYGGSWKLELSIHDGFADCCKEHDK